MGQGAAPRHFSTKGPCLERLSSTSSSGNAITREWSREREREEIGRDRGICIFNVLFRCYALIGSLYIMNFDLWKRSAARLCGSGGEVRLYLRIWSDGREPMALLIALARDSFVSRRASFSCLLYSTNYHWVASGAEMTLIYEYLCMSMPN